jgi:hypothetical protein
VPRLRTGRGPRAGRGYSARRDAEGGSRHGRVRGPRGVATAAPAEFRPRTGGTPAELQAAGTGRGRRAGSPRPRRAEPQATRARARRGRETWPGRESRAGRGEECRTAGSCAGGHRAGDAKPRRGAGTRPLGPGTRRARHGHAGGRREPGRADGPGPRAGWTGLRRDAEPHATPVAPWLGRAPRQVPWPGHAPRRGCASRGRGRRGEVKERGAGLTAGRRGRRCQGAAGRRGGMRGRSCEGEGRREREGETVVGGVGDDERAPPGGVAAQLNRPRGACAREAGGGCWAAGQAGLKGEEGGERGKEKIFLFLYFLDEWFHNFNQSKRMHGSAWCNKQNRVFLGFYLHEISSQISLGF